MKTVMGAASNYLASHACPAQENKILLGKTNMSDDKKKTEEEVWDGEDLIIKVPISDELDLHHFSPKEIKGLIHDYIEACREKGIWEVRIIHGKGRGQLLRSVHSILEKHPMVLKFQLGDERSGSWGATRTYLKKKSS